MGDKVEKTQAQWRAELTPEQYRVTREKGTERAFTGEYYATKSAGTYRCVCCGEPLFSSARKYDSGSGWPSFTQPLEASAIDEHTDASHGMLRTEIACARCDAHLGHVFPDGPAAAGGLRYCVNSCSLRLDEEA